MHESAFSVCCGRIRDGAKIIQSSEGCRRHYSMRMVSFFRSKNIRFIPSGLLFFTLTADIRAFLITMVCFKVTSINCGAYITCAEMQCIIREFPNNIPWSVTIKCALFSRMPEFRDFQQFASQRNILKRCFWKNPVFFLKKEYAKR